MVVIILANYFNIDGIIMFNNKSNLDQIISKCTEEYYNANIEAIIDSVTEPEDFVTLLTIFLTHYLMLLANSSRGYSIPYKSNLVHMDS